MVSLRVLWLPMYPSMPFHPIQCTPIPFDALSSHVILLPISSSSSFLLLFASYIARFVRELHFRWRRWGGRRRRYSIPRVWLWTRRYMQQFLCTEVQRGRAPSNGGHSIRRRGGQAVCPWRVGQRKVATSKRHGRRISLDVKRHRCWSCGC